MAKLRTLCGYIDEFENIWIPSYDKNLLFRKDKGDAFCRLACERKLIEGQIFSNVRKTYCMGKNIFFFSSFECSVAIVNSIDSSVEYWKYYEKEYIQISEILFSGDICWIIPSNLLFPVLKLDITNRCVEEMLLDVSNNCFSRGIITNEYICIANRDCNEAVITLIDFNEKTFNFNVSSLIHIKCLCAEERCIWVLGVDCEKKTKIVKYDINKKQVVDYYICGFDVSISKDNLDYFKIIKRGDLLFLLPENALPFRCIDWNEKKEVSIVDKRNCVVLTGYFEIQEKEDVLYLFTLDENVVTIFDFNTRVIENVELLYEYKNEVIELNNCYNCENEFNTLSDFLHEI